MLNGSEGGPGVCQVAWPPLQPWERGRRAGLGGCSGGQPGGHQPASNTHPY